MAGMERRAEVLQTLLLRLRGKGAFRHRSIHTPERVKENLSLDFCNTPQTGRASCCDHYKGLPSATLLSTDRTVPHPPPL